LHSHFEFLALPIFTAVVVCASHAWPTKRQLHYWPHNK